MSMLLLEGMYGQIYVQINVLYPAKKPNYIAIY